MTNDIWMMTQLLLSISSLSRERRAEFYVGSFYLSKILHILKFVAILWDCNDFRAGTSAPTVRCRIEAQFYNFVGLHFRRLLRAKSGFDSSLQLSPMYRDHSIRLVRDGNTVAAKMKRSRVKAFNVALPECCKAKTNSSCDASGM
jgi:hypothetical protein